MPDYTIEEATAQFEELIARVERGEQIRITRRQTSRADESGHEPNQLARGAKKLREAQPMSSVSSVDLIHQMRDEGY